MGEEMDRNRFNNVQFFTSISSDPQAWRKNHSEITHALFDFYIRMTQEIYLLVTDTKYHECNSRHNFMVQEDELFARIAIENNGVHYTACILNSSYDTTYSKPGIPVNMVLRRPTLLSLYRQKMLSVAETGFIQA